MPKLERILIYTPKYFLHKEFKCPCCDRVRVAEALIFALDNFRRVWTSPILIKSGFRCAKYNSQVGGDKNSRHLIGCAADIKPHAPELFDVFKFEAENLFKFLPDWELKIYKNFIHVAVPRSERFFVWSGQDININFFS